MVFHALVHLDVSAAGVRFAVSYLPGVPAFFFVSGFLISASWERNPLLRTYAVNRALRIFPALVGVLGFSVLTLVVFFDAGVLAANAGKFTLWALGQITLLQDWNPDFLRTWGIGGVNGSLWTIPVELSFYAFVPVLYWLFRRSGAPRVVLGTVIALSLAVQVMTYSFQHSMPELLFKLITKTPIPWLWMFCAGVLAQRSLPAVYPLVAGRLGHFAALYLGVSLASWALPAYPLLLGTSNNMGVVNFAALAGLVLAAAYTRSDMAERLLCRNDVSYGVYIFHIPVINVFVELGVSGWTAFVPAVALSVALAAISWFVVEKPSLRLRHWALYQR